MTNYLKQEISRLNEHEIKKLLEEKEAAYNYLVENNINKEMQRVLKSEIKQLKTFTNKKI